MTDQAARLRALAARSRPAVSPEDGGGRVVAVTSGKGGVGKTSLVANLATALAGRGVPVTVLDADFGLANLDILLNLAPARNLGHLLRGEARGEDVVVTVEQGFRVIPGASGVEALADLDPAARDRVLAELGPLAGSGGLLLIDTAAGIGRNVVDLCLAAGEVIVVTNGEPTSLTDAYGLIKVLWGRGPDTRVRLVVNSARDEAEGRAVYERLAEVVQRFLGRDVAFLGTIVEDAYVRRAARRQTPFVAAYPRSPAARCVARIADDLVRDVRSDGPGAGGFWARLAGAGT